VCPNRRSNRVKARALRSKLILVATCLAEGGFLDRAAVNRIRSGIGKRDMAT
jgi:hypothetical protein